MRDPFRCDRSVINHRTKGSFDRDFSTPGPISFGQAARCFQHLQLNKYGVFFDVTADPRFIYDSSFPDQIKMLFGRVLRESEFIYYISYIPHPTFTTHHHHPVRITESWNLSSGSGISSLF